MTTLVSKLTRLQSRLQTLHTKFGEPQYQRILIRRSINDTFIDEFIEPTPKVVNALTSNTGREVIDRVLNSRTGQNTKVSESFILVEEVMRLYDKAYFEENIQFFVLNPLVDEFNSLVYQGDKPIGEYYRLAKILDKDITTFSLILEKFKDPYSGNVL
jgi:hypothetical protein